MALGAIELVDSSGIVLNPKGAAIQPSVPQGPGALEKMSPMESMQEVFFDIRDGITNLGDIFKEKISGLNSHLAFRLETLNKTMSTIGTVAADDFALQEKAFADEQSDQRMDERGKNLGDQDVPTDTDGEKSGFSLPSFSLPKMPDVGPKGKIAIFSLIAAGLFAFADKINAVVGPALKTLREDVFPRIKMFFNIIKEDIGPIFENIIDFFKEAFDGVGDLLKGAFEGDATLFLTGVKKIFLDLPIRFISIIGDAFFSLADAALQALGIDAPWVGDIATAFRELPEAIDKAIQATIDFFVITIPKKFNEIIDFFTETIPTKLGEMRDNIMTGIKDMISFIVDPIVQLKNDITESVGLGVDKIKDGILNVVTKIKDTFTKLVNGLKGMANAVIDKINLVLPKRFEITKFEITPIDQEVVNVKVEEKTGDASVAEKVAQGERATVEGDKIRDRQELNLRVGSMRTYVGGSSPYDINYDKDISQQGTDSALFGDEYVKEQIAKSLEAQTKLAMILENTLQNQELRANAEASKPIIVANSTKQGDVTNQTSVHSAEPASDHSDLTAKALASAMMG
jgi:hypothetical protein